MSGPPLPVVRVDGGSVAGALDPAVLRGLAPADLARWLMTRRWFGAKGRPPVEARITEVVPLDWDGDRAVVTRIIATDGAGVSRSYQLPLVAREGEPADERAAGATLARIVAGARRAFCSTDSRTPAFARGSALR